MNYIGSKATLLPFIGSVIEQKVNGKVESVSDIFAGTGAVGVYFKKLGAEVIANDIQYYSYVLNKHWIENTADSNFNGLDIPCFNCLFEDKFSAVKSYLENIPTQEGFVYKNYSMSGTKDNDTQRLYFSDSNALRCDTIRQEIERLYRRKSITQGEYFRLIASLLAATDKVANTASVYGAFLKKLKATAVRNLVFDILPTVDNGRSHKVFNRDANDLVREIEGQVLYLDPPYNHRQYAPNYHILETVARYDNPQIKGITGLRDYSNQKSKYCLKNEAQNAFADLIENAKFDYIFLSYNNEGIIPSDFIEKIFKSKGRYSVESTPYNRFKADNARTYKADGTVEFLHCVKCNR